MGHFYVNTPAPPPTASRPIPQPPPPAQNDSGENVIFITLDGARHQDVFDREGSRLRHADEAQVMPYLNGKRTQTFISDKVSVANPYLISLPAYESMMTGEVTPCATNTCARVTTETLPERVRRELKLSQGAVATFGSWDKIARAAEHTPGTTFVNTGTQADATGGSDSEQKERWDKDTWALSMDYLTKNKPRLMFISLNDPDHWAHGGARDNYLQALRDDDSRIRELETKLATMGAYGRKTTVIVTTDHGRGNGARWTDHGAKIWDKRFDLPESRDVWLYAHGPHVDPTKASQLSATHLDIRPTVEKLLGLKPTQKPLDAIAP